MQKRSAESSPEMSSSLSRKQKIPKLYTCLSALLAVCVWQAASMIFGNELIFVSPAGVVKRLFSLCGEPEFYGALLFTLKRILLGFLSGLAVGALFAALAARFRLAEILLAPYMVTIRSVPVASFTVVALICFTAANLSWLISFLMVLPIVYTNLLDGIRSADEKLLEAASVFGMSHTARLRFIYLPQIKPFLLSAAKTSMGLAWKSGVAAELIGSPAGSVGEALYYTKLYIETADLFAWTVAIVLASVICEKVFCFLLRKAFERSEKL